MQSGLRSMLYVNGLGHFKSKINLIKTNPTFELSLFEDTQIKRQTEFYFEKAEQQMLQYK